MVRKTKHNQGELCLVCFGDYIMALAKYYEEILERLYSNVSSVNYLMKPENKWIISDERWDQILVNLKNQTEKAEKILKELSNKDLLQLQNEVDNLKLENFELRNSHKNLKNANNSQNIYDKKFYIQQAVIYRHDIKGKFTLILSENHENELVINHNDCSEIIDYSEGTILDITVDAIGDVFAVRVSDKKELGKFAKFTHGKLKMANNANYAIIKSHGKTYVPEWVCENFYQRKKVYKVYYLEVEKHIIDEMGRSYDKVALQVFILEN